MGIILGALAGAGEALQNRVKMWDQQDLNAQNSQLALQRDQSLATFNNTLQQGPINRFAALAGQHTGDTTTTTTPVPAPGPDAYQGMQLDGKTGVPDGSTGYTGDITQALTDAASIQNPDRQQQQLGVINAQINAQSDAIRANAPTTQTITQPASSQDIMDSALKDALKSGDGSAYQAGFGLKHSDAMLQYMQSRVEAYRERYENQSLNQQERNANQLLLNQATAGWRDAQAAALDAGGKNGSGSVSSKMQNIAFMQANPQLFTDDDVKSVMLERPQINPVDIATRLMTSDPNIGTNKAMTPAQASATAAQLVAAVKAGLPNKPGAPPPAGAPGANRPPLSSFQTK